MKENHQISLLVHCYLIKEKKTKTKGEREKKIMCICARFSGPDPAMSPPNPAPGSAASDAAAPPHIIITKKKTISRFHRSIHPNWGQMANTLITKLTILIAPRYVVQQYRTQSDYITPARSSSHPSPLITPRSHQRLDRICLV